MQHRGNGNKGRADEPRLLACRPWSNGGEMRLASPASRQGLDVDSVGRQPRGSFVPYHCSAVKRTAGGLRRKKKKKRKEKWILSCIVLGKKSTFLRLYLIPAADNFECSCGRSTTPCQLILGLGTCRSRHVEPIRNMGGVMGKWFIVQQSCVRDARARADLQRVWTSKELPRVPRRGSQPQVLP